MDKMLFVTNAITQTSEKDLEGVGRLRWIGEKCYRWVKYVGSGVLAAGHVVCHDLSDGVTAFQEIILPQTTDLSLLAGVAVDAVAAGDSTAQYCWVQCFGPTATCQVKNNTETDLTIGSYLVAVTGQVYGANDALVQPAYTRNIQSLAVVSTATTTELATSNIAAIINCL